MPTPAIPALPEQADPFRYGKAYTPRQAARLAGVSPSTVTRWLKGYAAPGHQMAPVFDGSPQERAQATSGLSLSFLQLIEIVVVAQFRRGSHPVQLERLRRAHAFARDHFGLAYPFASLKLREFGGHVLHEFDAVDPDGTSLALDLAGQWTLPGVVRLALEQVDFSPIDGFAERWFPAGRSTGVVLDPRMGAGRLTVAGTGITVETLYERFLAGESIEMLADDYSITADTVQAAIRLAGRPDLAAA